MAIRSRDAIIRSGQFKTEDATGTGQDAFIVIAGRVGAYYRIFNSGKNEFTVKGAMSDAAVQPGSSVDIRINTSPVSVLTEDAEPIEGIYEALTQSDLRSGKFKLAAAGQATIIDLNAASGARPKTFYRVYNTGQETFDITRHDGTLIASVEKECSVDIEVPDAAAPGRTVVIKTSGTAEGLYELLGIQT